MCIFSIFSKWLLLSCGLLFGQGETTSANRSPRTAKHTALDTKGPLIVTSERPSNDFHCRDQPNRDPEVASNATQSGRQRQRKQPISKTPGSSKHLTLTRSAETCQRMKSSETTWHLTQARSAETCQRMECAGWRVRQSERIQTL